jgi:DNA-directed RNA polymerase specialized sigma24 family protein
MDGVYYIMESGIMPCSGIDTVAISEELARMKAYKNMFAYYDRDDIAQEIWLSVNKASAKFDPSRVTKKALQFFNVVSENALKNLKRDNRIIDNVSITDTPIKEDESFASEVRAKEMLSFILEKLPPSLHAPFMRMVEYGGEGVTQYIKTKIRTNVLRILEEYEDG